MARKKRDDAPPADTDANYVEFVMAPLRTAWRSETNKHRNRNPVSLDEAALLLGEKTFDSYRIGRHRQWLLLRLDESMSGGREEMKDKNKGQATLL